MGINALTKSLQKEKYGQFDTLEAFSRKFYLQHHRNVRVAVDGYQWVYQIQKRAGTSLPLFIKMAVDRFNAFMNVGAGFVVVFDGSEKPEKKKRWAKGSSNVYLSGPREINYLKILCSCLSIPTIEAAGEGEAECAMLQREGVVDYVFSNDSDVFLNGATRVLMYDILSADLKSVGRTKARERWVWSIDLENDTNIPNLDRNGFILCGLLIGGDYEAKAGSKGIGVKLAREIANKSTGFSSELGDIFPDLKFTNSRSDNAIASSPSPDKVKKQAWLDRLHEELQTNKSGFFSSKHPSIAISADFPDPKMVQYYSQPAINTEKIDEDSLNLFAIPDSSKLFNLLLKTFPKSDITSVANLFGESFLIRRILDQSDKLTSYTIQSPWKSSETDSFRVRFLDSKELLNLKLDDLKTNDDDNDDYYLSLQDRPIPDYILNQSTNNPIQAYKDRLLTEQLIEKSKRPPRIEDFFGTTKPETNMGTKDNTNNDMNAPSSNIDTASSITITNTKVQRSKPAARKKPSTGAGKSSKLGNRQNSRDRSISQFFTSKVPRTAQAEDTGGDTDEDI